MKKIKPLLPKSQMDPSYLKMFGDLSDEISMQYDEQEHLTQIKDPSPAQVEELAALAKPTLELEENWNAMVKTYVRDAFERKRILIA